MDEMQISKHARLIMSEISGNGLQLEARKKLVIRNFHRKDEHSGAKNLCKQKHDQKKAQLF